MTDLEKKWDKILKSEGLTLKQGDHRTVRFKNKDIILNFFLYLDTLLTHHPGMDKFEYNVLTQYSNGLSLLQITKNLRVSRNRVNRVIKRYQGIILAIQNIELAIQSPLSMSPQSIGTKDESGNERSIYNQTSKGNGS